MKNQSSTFFVPPLRLFRRAASVPIILVAFALLLSGCVSTELRVTNHTGAGIYIYSGHTKKMTMISAGATRTVPHTSGRIIVVTQRDEVWEYNNVQSLVDEATRGYKRVSLHVEIGSDGVVTLPSGRKIEPTKRSFALTVGQQK